MDLIQALEKSFTSHANDLIAAGQKAYLQNKFEFLGIKKPDRSRLEKLCFKKYPITSETQLIEFIEKLWLKKEREYHYAALELSFAYRKLWSEKLFSVLSKIIEEHSWWDSVDTIATKLVGPLLLKYPSLQIHMDEWIDHSFMWKRRAALVFQLSYKDKTNHLRLFRYSEKTMHEKEFFIRKAIGWALRQYSKTNPQAVRQFITVNKNGLSSLSFKEASKYC